jgi:hypothetical protein
MRLKNMVKEPIGPQTKNDCEAKGKRQISRPELNHIRLEEVSSMFYWMS